MATSAENAVATLPAELQAPAARFFERLAANHALPDDALMPALARVVAGSEFAATVLLREWDELAERLTSFDAPLERCELERFVEHFLDAGLTLDAAKAALRRERNRHLVHILWRDVIARADVEETLGALSMLADQMLTAAAGYAERAMRERYGTLCDADGNTVPLVIIGMGKLGGGELNFSSDIDIIFTYPRDGRSDGAKELHAQTYFDRLSRNIITLINDVTADGFVYRTDTRLRPFGDSGPPVVSFAALESYLLQHGRDWERYAYVKASIVGPRPTAAVAQELHDSMIRPFVYRRYLDYGVFESLRDMHARISAEVQRRDLADNVKLGPGGIREIEFIVQSLQLVRGGGRPELQSPSLLAVLPKLVDGRSLDTDAARSLDAAYRFLRRLENAIQALRDAQTHDLPADATDRARLCLLLGERDWDALAARIGECRDVVSTQFDAVAFRGRDRSGEEPLRNALVELWDRRADAAEWQERLAQQGFTAADAIAAQLAGFREASALRTMDTLGRERLRTFVPRLLELVRATGNPERALSRSLAVLERVLRRSAYIALLNENRLAAERLVSLCEKSESIATELARYPVLLDELLDPRLLTGPMSRAELKAELEARIADADVPGSEEHMELLAQFQRANMFRVAVADFSGTLPIMKVSDSLTFLAETVLEHALAVAWADVAERHGQPTFDDDGERRVAGFGIIGYGKLGGLELSYGSDLDIVFLHDSRGSRQTTDGARPLDNAVFFSRLVRRLMHFLTTTTSTGELYEIDMRLRPSGRKGLLVTSVDAFERYQDENAWTWEHQALLRARPVAGSAQVASEFERVRADTLMHRVRRESLKDDVLSMRARMRTELDRSDATTFDLKQGVGGIGDIEFLVQYLVLEHAERHPAVIEYSDNIRQLDALAACDVVTPSTAEQLQDIYRAFRLRQHHLVLNNEPARIPADEFAAERAAVEKLWARVFES